MSNPQVIQRLSEAAATLLLAGVCATTALIAGSEGARASLVWLPAIVAVMLALLGCSLAGSGLRRWRRAWRERVRHCQRCGAHTEFCPTNCYIRYYRCPRCDVGR
ncbi:hypothetical protein [Chitinolyticbacter meiyuanensis]|uniref:hypothetical protein n=1 Tax=Chitinolyticbacter meiyuanensis TaxID=682798 RepID=UPI0011E5B8C4|nr:hypothetical protein [Chitinolyticbacter meiyuanensis]